MIIEHVNEPQGASGSREFDAVEAILRRYPNVTDAEAERAIAFLIDAPILERGRLSARPGIATKMEQIRKDRPKAFAPSKLGYGLLAVFIAALAAIIWMMAGVR